MSTLYTFIVIIAGAVMSAKFYYKPPEFHWFIGLCTGVLGLLVNVIGEEYK